MNNLIKLSFLMIAVLLMGMQSCKSTSNSAQKSVPTSVEIGGTWILKSFEGENVANVFKGNIPTITMDFAENRVNGNGGCNNYFGGFVYKDGIFSAPNVASTMMMCVFENKESQYYAMLGKPNSVSVVNGVLTFKNEGKVVAEFVRNIDTAMLEGKWMLESIQGEDMKKLFPAEDIEVYLEFDVEKGRLTGIAGCNRYGSTYKLNGLDIEVGMVTTTRMACPNMEGEGKFTNAISGASTLNVTNNTLTFSKDGASTLIFRKEVK